MSHILVPWKLPFNVAINDIILESNVCFCVAHVDLVSADYLKGKHGGLLEIIGNRLLFSSQHFSSSLHLQSFSVLDPNSGDLFSEITFSWQVATFS